MIVLCFSSGINMSKMRVTQREILMLCDMLRPHSISAFTVYLKKIITHWTYRTEREMGKQYSSVIIADRKTAGIHLQSCALCGSLIDLVLTPPKQKLKSMFFEHPNTLSCVPWQEPFKHSQTLMCVFMWWLCWTQACSVNLLSFLCEAAESFCLRMKYRGHPHSHNDIA